MTKMKFLLSLNEQLKDLPHDDVQEHLNFYSEMIEDRMEEGLSEEDAVSAVGSVEEIAKQISSEIHSVKMPGKKINDKKQMKVWEITLLILGSPIWISLMIALLAVILSLYVCLYALLISLWAIFAAIAGSTLGILIAGVVYICTGNQLTGIAMVGAAIFCLGLSIFVLYGCKIATKWSIKITTKLAHAIRNCFIKKEAA